MNLYTHAVLAARLQNEVKPMDAADYLWGAVAPDVRYLAGMRRAATHLADEEIAAWRSRYPGCESFIQGYRMHCLLDRIDTVAAVSRAFPLRLLRKKFSSQQMAVVIELYHLRAFPRGLALAGGQNAILEGLGVKADQAANYASALQGYLAAPSFDTAAAFFVKVGIIEDARIEKYIQAYRAMAGSPLLLLALTISVKNARLEKLARAMVRELIW